MHCHALNNTRSKRSKQYALICTAFKNKFNTTSERGKESFGYNTLRYILIFILSPSPVSPPRPPRGSWCWAPCGSWARSACQAASPRPRAGWAPPAASTWTPRSAPWCRSRNSSEETKLKYDCIMLTLCWLSFWQIQHWQNDRWLNNSVWSTEVTFESNHNLVMTLKTVKIVTKKSELYTIYSLHISHLNKRSSFLLPHILVWVIWRRGFAGTGIDSLFKFSQFLQLPLEFPVLGLDLVVAAPGYAEVLLHQGVGRGQTLNLGLETRHSRAESNLKKYIFAEVNIGIFPL